MATKRKAPRSKFALPGKKKFPLNTLGRIKAAPGLAARSRKAGNISRAEEATVKRKASAARKRYRRRGKK